VKPVPKRPAPVAKAPSPPPTEFDDFGVQVDEFEDARVDTSNLSREEQWKIWLTTRPKWFWIVTVLAACLIGGVMQMVFFPMYRGRVAEEMEQQKKAQQQQPADGEKQATDKK